MYFVNPCRISFTKKKKKGLISYTELKVIPKLFYFFLLPNWSTWRTIYNSVSSENKKRKKERLFQKITCFSGDAKDLLIPFWNCLLPDLLLLTSLYSISAPPPYVFP